MVAVLLGDMVVGMLGGDAATAAAAAVLWFYRCWSESESTELNDASTSVFCVYSD